MASGKGTRFPQTDGLCGGYPGAANAYLHITKRKQETDDDRFPRSLDTICGEARSVAWGGFSLSSGDALYIRWNGGGGFGDPLTRDPEKVAADVASSIISHETARDLYAVVVAEGKLDIHGTSTLRASRRLWVHGQNFATKGVRYSETLRLINGKISCANCGEAISVKGAPWKTAAKLAELTIANMPGAPPSIDSKVFIREFSCPKCNGVLDTEIARPDHPFLEDTIFT